MTLGDVSPTIRSTSARSRGLNETTLWCERKLHGGRNSGRAVAIRKSGACATALGKRLQKVERGRVGPVQVLDHEHDGLRTRAGENPGRHRRQLPAAQLFRRKAQRAAGGQRNVHDRGDEGRMFARVEADQSQRAFEIGKALLGGKLRAEPLAAPFGE